MALINLAPTVTFTLVDETGSKSAAQLSIPAATTVADARTAADALTPLIQAVTGCSIEGYAINFSTTETAPAPAAANSRVERKGVLTFRTAAGKIATVSIPGIIDAIVLSSGRIDDDNADVAALVADLLAPPWSDSNGSDLAALVEAYEKFRTSTKGTLPRDRKPDAA